MNSFVRLPKKILEDLINYTQMSSPIAELDGGCRLYASGHKDSSIHLYADVRDRSHGSVFDAGFSVASYLKAHGIHSFRMSFHFGVMSRNKSSIAVRLAFPADFDRLVPSTSYVPPIAQVPSMDPLPPISISPSGDWADEPIDE